jgi:hypothetical protein
MLRNRAEVEQAEVALRCASVTGRRAGLPEPWWFQRTGTVVEDNKVKWRCLDVIQHNIFMYNTSRQVKRKENEQETTGNGSPFHRPILKRTRYCKLARQRSLKLVWGFRRLSFGNSAFTLRFVILDRVKDGGTLVREMIFGGTYKA